MSTMTDERPIDELDPIDALIPRPRPWWVRLVAGALTVGLVGVVAFLWGFGYVTPRPDCCGSSDGSSVMSLSADGAAVAVTAYFYNSSGRNVIVESAEADLPGAEVIDVSVVDPDPTVYPIDDSSPLPAIAPAREGIRLLVTFVPTDCVDSTEAGWGTVDLDLDVEGWWSFGRRYEIQVLETPQDLSVLPPVWVVDPPQTPLAAACALLGR